MVRAATHWQRCDAAGQFYVHLLDVTVEYGKPLILNIFTSSTTHFKSFKSQSTIQNKSLRILN